MILLFEIGLVMIGCGYIKWVWSSMGVTIKDRSIDVCLIIRSGEIIIDVCGHEWDGYLRWVTCSSLGPKTPDYQKAP